MTTRPRMVFFGSGPVALESLRQLSPHFDIEAIITKPATQTELAQAFPRTPILAVQNKRELDDLITKQAFASKLGLLIDFGIIVSPAVIASFQMGIVNSHFSLLPEWRGADPITFAILSGQQLTGVSLMLLVPGMDEGPLLAQATYTIPNGATTPTLTQSLIDLSSATLQEIIPRYLAGSLTPQPQETAGVLGNIKPTYSRKLVKTDGEIDWHKSASTIECEIRAFIAWPHSYTSLAGRDVIVTGATVLALNGIPGTVHPDRRRLIVYCGEEALEITHIKPAGKPEMTGQAFLAGYGKLL